MTTSRLRWSGARFWTRTLSLLAAVLFAVFFVEAAEQYRTWTSRSGAQIEATLERDSGYAVVLQKRSGERVKISRSQLSAADLAYLSNLKREAAPTQRPGRGVLLVYHTSDLHEHSANLSRFAMVVKDAKARKPNVLFVDAGDWINRGDMQQWNTRGEAMVAALQAMGYDALVMGNHEKIHNSYGFRRLAELANKYELPVLAPEVMWQGVPKPTNAAPFRIFKLRNMDVAVIGTVPWPGTTPVAEMRKLVADLRTKADIILLLTHNGLVSNKSMAMNVPGIDAILAGHDHRVTPETLVEPTHKTVIQHTGYNGRYLGELSLTWDGRRVTKKHTRLIEMKKGMKKDLEVEKVLKSFTKNGP